MAHLFTHGTRGEPTKQTPIGEMPVSWEVVELGEIITEGPQNGIYKHASLYGEGTHILRIDDFDNDGNFVNLSLNRVRLTPDEVNRYRLSENDLVINRVNSLSHLGKCALILQFTDVTVFESGAFKISSPGQAARFCGCAERRATSVGMMNAYPAGRSGSVGSGSARAWFSSSAGAGPGTPYKRC